MFVFYLLGLRLVRYHRSNPALQQDLGKARFFATKIFDRGIKAIAIMPRKQKATAYFFVKTRGKQKARQRSAFCADLALAKDCLRYSRQIWS